MSLRRRPRDYPRQVGVSTESRAWDNACAWRGDAPTTGPPALRRTPDNATELEAFKRPIAACCGDTLAFSWKGGKNHGVVQIPGPECPASFTPGSNGQVQVAPQSEGGDVTVTLPSTPGTVYYGDDAPADKQDPTGKAKCQDGAIFCIVAAAHGRMPGRPRASARARLDGRKDSCARPPVPSMQACCSR